MSYSFKDDVASRLPEGYTLVRMYSTGDDTTSVEGTKDGNKVTFSLPKVNIGDYFSNLPTISIGASASMNDLYAKISDMYGLGFESNVDYYDSSAVNPSSNPRYVELPLSRNSYGYKGVIRVYVILEAFSGRGLDSVRDLCDVAFLKLTNQLKLRLYLQGTLFTITKPYFIGTSLSVDFIDEIVKNIDTQLQNTASDTVRTLLSSATILETINDGISDIVFVMTDKKEIISIRYLGCSIKNNAVSDTTSDSSKELPDTSDESSAEKPESGEGDLNTGEQSEHPYSSTEGNNEQVMDEDIDLDIG